MATVEHGSHLKLNPFGVAQAQLHRVAEIFGIDDSLVRVLERCKKSVVVSIPTRMDDGSIRVFDGFRAQHNIARGALEGRHPLPPGRHARRGASARHVDDLEVRADRIPFGGAKGGIACDPKSVEGRARADDSTLHQRDVREIGPEMDIPAPDVNTNGETMAWIFDTYSMNKGYPVLGVVTGKPLTIGGSLGREEATSRGALFTVREALKKLGRAGSKT